MQCARCDSVERLEAASAVTHATRAERPREPGEAAAEILTQQRLSHEQLRVAMSAISVKELCALREALGNTRKRFEFRREIDVQRDDPLPARRVHAGAQRRALAAVHFATECDESVIFRGSFREPRAARVTRSVVDRDALPARAERIGRLDERRPARRQHGRLVVDGPHETPVGGGGHRTMEADAEPAFTVPLAERASASGGALVTPAS